MGGRKEYTTKNPRLPKLTKNLNDLIAANGGISSVSALTGISRNTITFWSQGARIPDAVNLVTLSKKLNVSVDYLLGLSPNPSTNESVKTVNAVTGLSVESINYLSNCKKNKPFIISSNNNHYDRSVIMLVDKLISYNSDYLSKISSAVRQAVSSLRVCKIKGQPNEEDNEDIIFNPMIQDLYSQLGLNPGELSSTYDIPSGTILISASDASEFFKEKAMKAFSLFLDEYISNTSDAMIVSDKRGANNGEHR